jgi:hypothetical protein
MIFLSKVHEMYVPRTRINIQQLLEVQNAEILTAAERAVIYRQVLDVRMRATFRESNRSKKLGCRSLLNFFMARERRGHGCARGQHREQRDYA